MMPGFRDRFEDEIIKYAQNSAKTDINVCADLHRKHAAWIGGSMLASFSTFKDMCITNEEYYGANDMERNAKVLQKSIN